MSALAICHQSRIAPGDVPVSRYRIDRDSDTIAKRLRRSGSIDRILGQDSKSEQLARGLREDQVEIRNSG
jgi:hypothetical protein